MFDYLIGDHTEISAVTKAKRDERNKIFANLPQKTQELLFPKPIFFTGNAEDAGDWIQSTKVFTIYNQMEFSFTLDILLRRAAKLLWQKFSLE